MSHVQFGDFFNGAQVSIVHLVWQVCSNLLILGRSSSIRLSRREKVSDPRSFAERVLTTPDSEMAETERHCAAASSRVRSQPLTEGSNRMFSLLDLTAPALSTRRRGLSACCRCVPPLCRTARPNHIL